MAKGIERSLNSVLKTIAKLSDVQKRAKSKTTKSYLIRKGKIKLYKEIAKELKRGLKGEPINKQFIDLAKSMIKEITPKRKTIAIEWGPRDNVKNLLDKYSTLINPHRKDFLSRGILSALKSVGYNLDESDIEKIEEMLGIEGLDWDSTVSIIATYLHYPIEELFYSEPIIDKGSGRIDKNYFLGRLTELINEIRAVKRDQSNVFNQMLQGVQNG